MARVAVGEKTELMKVPADMVSKLRVIAAVRRRSMADLLREYAGERVEAEHRAAAREVSKSVKKAGD